MKKNSTKSDVSVTGSQLPEGPSLVSGLNMARGLATLLVLLGHVGIAYLSVPLRSCVWVVHDQEHHLAVDIVLCLINAVSMPLFFLMAGMSVGTGCASGSIGNFLKRRLERLGTPLVVGCLTIVPVCYVLWGLGLLLTERVPMAQIYRMNFSSEMHSNSIGPFHLWFLEYLLILSFIWALSVAISRRLMPHMNAVLSSTSLVQRLLGSPLTYATLTCGVLMLDLDAAYRLQNTFIPDLYRLLHYFVFFAAGAWMVRLPQPGETLMRRAGWRLAMAGVLYVAILPWMLHQVGAPLAGLPRIGLAAGQSLVVWFALFGGLGICLRLASQQPSWLRYVTEASFWTYLVHLPIVAATQLALWEVKLPLVLKLCLVSGAGLLGSLLSYEWCVRYSLVGALINGARKRLKGASWWRKEIAWISVAASLLIPSGWFLISHREQICGPNLEAVIPGKVYRSLRFKEDDLQQAFAEHHFQTIINMKPANAQDAWFVAQQKIAVEHGAQVRTFEFSEEEVPSSWQMESLVAYLKTAPRPILIQGHRTPTLGGLGGAIALLLEEDGDPTAAGEQFSRQHFQLEGVRHCIVAAPIRNYDLWLHEQQQAHSPQLFEEYLSQVHRSPQQLQQVENEDTIHQARLGAPRFNVRLR